MADHNTIGPAETHQPLTVGALIDQMTMGDGFVVDIEEVEPPNDCAAGLVSDSAFAVADNCSSLVVGDLVAVIEKASGTLTCLATISEVCESGDLILLEGVEQAFHRDGRGKRLEHISYYDTATIFDLRGTVLCPSERMERVKVIHPVFDLRPATLQDLSFTTELKGA